MAQPASRTKRIVEPPPGKWPWVFSSWPKLVSGSSDPDIGDQKKLVRHVPGIAMDRHDEGLGEEWVPLRERIDSLLGGDPRLLGCDERLECVDIDFAREMLAMAEEDSRAQRRVMIVVIVGRRQRPKGNGVDAILNPRRIDSEQRDLSTAFHSERGAARERDLGQMRFRCLAFGSCRLHQRK